MESKGYTKHELTIDVKKANLLAMIIPVPLAAVMALIYFAVNRGIHNFEIFWDAYIAIGLCMILIVVHELIHGITWAIFTQSKFKAISFGVIWKALTPYCTCSESLGKWQYIIGAAMPTVILGILLSIIAIIAESFMLLITAEFMIFGGGGDMAIILKMLAYKPKGKDVVFYDHPYECGMVTFEK